MVPSSTAEVRVNEDEEVSVKSMPGRCASPETYTAREPTEGSYANAVRVNRVCPAVAMNA
jgi:hypothetical protein